MNTLSVAVLVSAGRHPATGAPRACRGDAVAMALGHRLAGEHLRVVFAGAKDEPALLDYLAYGAREIEVVSGAGGSDTGLARRLSRQLSGADVILTGCRAENGLGSGLLPYALAEELHRPIAANILDIDASVQDLQLRQFLPKGKRRTLAVPRPAVLTIHPLAPVQLSYAHARRVSGRITEYLVDAPDTSDDAPEQTWTVTPAGRQLVRLKAGDKKSAQDRLNAAIATEVKRGTTVSSGSDLAKAEAILAYLREHRLVDF